MWRTVIALCVLVALSSASSAEEIIARTSTPPWELSIIQSGEGHTKDCRLWLNAKTYPAERQISLKRDFYDCGLYGHVLLFATASKDYKRLSIVVEAARGGDGDHTGPILEFFYLDEQGFRKLGEQELFDASYVRREGQLVQINGKVLFDFCDACDGPQVADPTNITVPVRITFGCDGICVKAAVSPSQAQAIRKSFLSRKKKASDENKNDDYKERKEAYSRQLEELESKLDGLLDNKYRSDGVQSRSVVTETVAKISVLRSGQVMLNGRPADLAAVEAEYRRLQRIAGEVWYYREDSQTPLRVGAEKAFDAAMKYRLPVSMSSKPDFSDYIDGSGVSRPRQP